jgi:hypothetical protein
MVAQNAGSLKRAEILDVRPPLGEKVESLANSVRRNGEELAASVLHFTMVG